MPPSPEHINRERTGTIKSIHERESLMDAYKQATSRYEIAMTSNLVDERAELAKLDVDIAQQELELFDQEHDPTGAWKGKKFGRDLAKIFDHEFVAEEHGKLVPTEALKQTHLLVVSMGELDRLNKEGGHKLGDGAMALTHEQIAEQVEAFILASEPDIAPEQLASRYDVYRSGGNEFSVVMRGVKDPNSINGLVAGFDRVGAVSEKNKGIEAPPLITNSLSMEEVYEVLNTVRREDGMQDFLSRRSGEKTRIAVDIVKELALTENDILKTRQRLERFEALLIEAQASGDLTKASAFYGNYLKKGLGTVFSGESEIMSDFPEAQKMMEQMGAFDAGWSEQWQKEKEQIALDQGFKRFHKKSEEERMGEQSLQRYVTDQVKQRYANHDYLEAKPESSVVFTDPQKTTGALILDRLKSASTEAAAVAEKDPIPKNQKLAERAQLDYRIESARRDAMTGLEERGALYESLEDAISRNQEVTTLFIDMAFLKYFDKEGGREVGDAAIKKAAQILDEITQDPRWKKEYPEASVRAFRYAGDEFTLTVEGADASIIDKLRKEISDRAAMSGNVPAHDVEGSYTPTKLSFNVGSSHIENKASIENLVTELNLPLHGEANSKERINHLAEYAIRFADKEIEISKAMDRYEYLIELIRQHGKDHAYTKQIMAYSQKAIFGEEGKAKVEAWASKLIDVKDDTELKKQARVELLEFTIQQKDKELANAHEEDRELETRIERHIREQYFVRKIEGLEIAIEKLTRQIETAKEENSKLHEELTKRKAIFEEERDAISSIREKMSSSG